MWRPSVGVRSEDQGRITSLGRRALNEDRADHVNEAESQQNENHQASRRLFAFCRAMPEIWPELETQHGCDCSRLSSYALLSLVPIAYGAGGFEM